MKSLEIIRRSNSLEELVSEIKGSKSKKKSFWERFGIKSFFERVNSNILRIFEKYPKTSSALLATLGLISTFLFVKNIDYIFMDALWKDFLLIASACFLLLSLIFFFIISTEIKKKDEIDAIVCSTCLISLSLAIFLLSMVFSSLSIILLSPIVPVFLLILGFYPTGEKEEKVRKLTKEEERAEQLNILSGWLREQKEEVIKNLKERKTSIRDRKDQFQGYLNTLELRLNDDSIRGKHGENIEDKIALIKDHLRSAEASLIILKDKEEFMTKAIEETVSKILPGFRKEQEFLQEMIEINQALDVAEEDIEKTKKLVRDIDQYFITLFTKVNSVLEGASVMNQALIEVTKDDFRNISRISEPIESFNIDELREVISLTSPKVHS